MEIYLNERPSVMPTVLTPASTGRTLLSVCNPLVPQAHQAQVQTELVRAAVSAGANGTSGFTGEGIRLGKKRMDVRGVPPRGRPV
ncbi:hypothetical protein ACI2K4_21790 [Micromonospora sp. NPDC050397]|uniref:hypothetical protein n=1 Tax=Micromonospora sp. NPDC050397 TaxID=3364279 RepID=UPI00384B5DAE